MRKALKVLPVTFALLVFWGSACSTVQEYANDPLIKRIVRARPVSPPKLVNRACLKYERGECVKSELTELDLRDEAVRKTLIELQFVCNIAGERFKICPDEPGFCQYTYSRKWFLGKKRLQIRKIPLEPFQFHVDAATRCFSSKEYSFGDVK